MDLDLGNDTSICGSGIIVLDAGPGFQQYTWQDGSNDQTYTAFGAGIYWVTVIDPCSNILTDTISISVSASPSVNIVGDTNICEGDIIQLSFTSSTGFSSFNWEPNTYLDCSTCDNPIAVPLAGIEYYLVASTAQGCTTMDSITITVNSDHSNAFQATVKDEICGNGNGSVQLDMTDNSAAPYMYNFNSGGYSTVNSFSDLTSGTYSVMIKDNFNCVYDTSLVISDNGSLDTLGIPNCFSPNNDNLNDTWYIPSTCGEKITCRIYNRWGQEIAQINHDQTWNGKINGTANADDGVYYYIAEIEYLSGEKKTYTGFINLLR
jgi:gliding motility-associated-like protein